MPKDYCKNRGFHGKQGTRVYNSWEKMLSRCRNPKNKDFHNYGGRGISVDSRWLDFRNFFADMGDPPAGMTLDRIDTNGNYSVSNCRWATRYEQARNMRRNLLLTLQGTTKTAAEWAQDLKIKVGTLYARKRRGWTDERTLSSPARNYSLR